MSYPTISALRDHLNSRIIGQSHLVNRLLIALLCDGHLLVEGAPGLAKTTAVKELALCLEGSFQRIQFTPDLLPADLTGTEIYRPQEGSFHFQEGPLFHNVVLADEINRAPAKVQSALLEAMAERQITVGNKTYPLAKLFLVMATQNPIEQEGTYPLPEAQLDRFLLYVKIDYPDAASEGKILQLNRHITAGTHHTLDSARPFLLQADLFKARQAVLAIHMSPEIEEYLVQLVMATRHPEKYDPDLKRWIRYGASPRGTIALDLAARAMAFLQQRDYVSPRDVLDVVKDVLGHRVLLSFAAEAEGMSSEAILDRITNLVPVP